MIQPLFAAGVPCGSAAGGVAFASAGGAAEPLEAWLRWQFGRRRCAAALALGRVTSRRSRSRGLGGWFRRRRVPFLHVVPPEGRCLACIRMSIASMCNSSRLAMSSSVSWRLSSGRGSFGRAASIAFSNSNHKQAAIDVALQVVSGRDDLVELTEQVCVLVVIPAADLGSTTFADFSSARFIAGSSLLAVRSAA